MALNRPSIDHWLKALIDLMVQSRQLIEGYGPQLVNYKTVLSVFQSLSWRIRFLKVLLCILEVKFSSIFPPSLFNWDKLRLLIMYLLQREFPFASGRRHGRHQPQIMDWGDLKLASVPSRDRLFRVHLIPMMWSNHGVLSEPPTPGSDLSIRLQLETAPCQLSYLKDA